MRALILLALFGAAFAAVPSPNTRNQQRIVGGSDASIEAYPYIGNLQLDVFGTAWVSWCGGSLITIRTVLSAAHCVEYISDLAIWRMSFGSADNSAGSDATHHNVAGIVMHDDYDEWMYTSDIAIVRLETPVVLSDTIALVSIAGPNYNLPDGTQLNVAGWGALSLNGGNPTILQHVNLNQINHELCRERYAFLKSQPEYSFYPDVTDGMLCAGLLDVGGASACYGDSGGPLVHQPAGLDSAVAVGIVSWGHVCGADPAYPNVYVRVSSYTDWIIANGSG